MSRPIEPSWPEILQAATEKAARSIHTALPGRVRSYDVATQTAEVQLVVHLDGAEVPPLADVPVVWPGGVTGFLHVPLAAGDTVLVVFAEEDFSGWFASGSISAPEVLARHGLHAIAIPGLRRPGVALSVTAGHVTLAGDEVRLGADGASDAVALEPGVAAVLGDFISQVATVVAALVAPTAVEASVKATFAGQVLALQARISGGEMAASKVKAE